MQCFPNHQTRGEGKTVMFEVHCNSYSNTYCTSCLGYLNAVLRATVLFFRRANIHSELSYCQLLCMHSKRCNLCCCWIVSFTHCVQTQSEPADGLSSTCFASTNHKCKQSCVHFWWIWVSKRPYSILSKCHNYSWLVRGYKCQKVRGSDY